MEDWRHDSTVKSTGRLLFQWSWVQYPECTWQLKQSVTLVPGILCSLLVSIRLQTHTWYTDIPAGLTPNHIINFKRNIHVLTYMFTFKI